MFILRSILLPITICTYLVLIIIGSTNAQVCELTQQLSQSRFKSAFRHSYFELFDGTNRGHNLAVMANRIYNQYQMIVVPNDKQGCMNRYEETKKRCQACVRSMGWKVPRNWFDNGGDTVENQREFTRIIRENGCVEKKPCQKSKLAKIPKPTVYTSTEEDANLDVRLRLAMIMDNQGVRFLYSVRRASVEGSEFGDTVADYSSKNRRADVNYYGCVRKALDEEMFDRNVETWVPVVDFIAREIESACMNEMGLEPTCAHQAIEYWLCQRLNEARCFPPGESLLSVCVV